MDYCPATVDHEHEFDDFNRCKCGTVIIHSHQRVVRLPSPDALARIENNPCPGLLIPFRQRIART
jgi:hypothetical protein